MRAGLVSVDSVAGGRIGGGNGGLLGCGTLGGAGFVAFVLMYGLVMVETVCVWFAPLVGAGWRDFVWSSAGDECTLIVVGTFVVGGWD